MSGPSVLTPQWSSWGLFDRKRHHIGDGGSRVLEEVPLSESSLITVDGRINAITDIHLSGHRVENTSTIASGRC